MLSPGLYEFVVSSRTADRVSTFPGAVPQEPKEWPFQTDTLWTFRVSTPGAALRLLNPREDHPQLSFVRPGEQYRNAFFQIVPAETADESALSLTLPTLAHHPPNPNPPALYLTPSL